MTSDFTCQVCFDGKRARVNGELWYDGCHGCVRNDAWALDWHGLHWRRHWGFSGPLKKLGLFWDDAGKR